MIDYCKEFDIRRIIIAKLDRSFRNTIDCLQVIDKLRSEGIEFNILDLDIDTSKANGRLFLTFLAAIAEWENRRREERQRDTMDVMKKENQRLGTIPYGWDAVKSMTRISKTTRQADDLVPNIEEQKVLRWLIERQGGGHSYKALATALNNENIPSKKGGKWHPSTVHSVIQHATLSDDYDIGHIAI